MHRTILVPLAVLAACKSDRDLFNQEFTDDFLQAPNNEVDILWVVDNSASMQQEQETLANGFASFAAQLDESGTVFNLAVISTSLPYGDPEMGHMNGDPPFITQDTPDYEAEFARRASLGIGGSDKEKGLEAATFALHPVMTLDGLGGPNEGFLRPDAQLLVVIVSDEEDCSDRGRLEGQPATACYSEIDELPPVSSFVQDLYDIKGDREMVQIGAIVGTKGSVCPEQYLGSRYLTAAALTGGLQGDICQSDWADMLSDLGLNATGIHTKFRLTYAAMPETIEVQVDGKVVKEDPASGWTYDDATWFLTFNGASVPARGSQITVHYTIQPGVLEPEATTL